MSTQRYMIPKTRLASQPRGFHMRMLATLSVAICTLLGCATQAGRVEVTRVGTYEIEDKTVVENKDSPTLVTLKTQADRTRTRMSPRQETSVVTALVGYSFGVEFKLLNRLPDGLRGVVRLPAPGLLDRRNGSRILSDEFKPTCNEARCTLIYNFEHESELIPGTWHVELWEGDRRLFAREFTLQK